MTLTTIAGTGAVTVTGKAEDGKDSTREITDSMFKQSKFPTKVVIRRLPASMNEKDFMDTISPLPEHDYFLLSSPDPTLTHQGLAWATINFINEDDVYDFKDRFDGYIFVDKTGGEYPAIVEFSPNQKIPKPPKHKKDSKNGTIDKDQEYIEFLELLENPGKSVKTLSQQLEEIDIREQERKVKVTTTPLLDYIREQRLEKRQKRDQRKENKKKREEERRKQKEEERKRRREKKLKEIHEHERRHEKQDEVKAPVKEIIKRQDHKEKAKEKGKKNRRDSEAEKSNDSESSKSPSGKKFSEKKKGRREESPPKAESEGEKEGAQMKRDQRNRERKEKLKNKERPTMQIYRPGMGKFSSQSIRKEGEENARSEEEKKSKRPRQKGTKDPDKKPDPNRPSKKVEQEDAKVPAEEVKERKSGKSYRDKRRERQQMREGKAASKGEDSGILTIE